MPPAIRQDIIKCITGIMILKKKGFQAYKNFYFLISLTTYKTKRKMVDLSKSHFNIDSVE